MKTVYFQPKGINPQYCDVGMISETDPEYIHYMDEPCKILISEVKIVSKEDFKYNKKTRTYETKAVLIADQLENEISDMDLGLTYIEIAKTAEFTAIKIREQIPMYTGNINPKWKLYDNVVALLKGRVNGC